MRRNSKREIKTLNLEEDVGPGRLPEEYHYVFTLDVEGGWTQKLLLRMYLMLKENLAYP